MTHLLIINAQGFGEEVATWIQAMPGFGTQFLLKGFLDNRTFDATTLPILAPPEAYVPSPDESLVIALADPLAKKRWADHFSALGGRFFTVVHPSNFISPTARIGRGAIIAPMNSISNHAVIGDFVTVYGFCKLGHDVKVGAYVHLASHISLDGGSQIPPLSAVPSFTKLEKGHHYSA